MQPKKILCEKQINQYLIYMFNMCHILFPILLGWDSKGLQEEFAPASLPHPEISWGKKKNKETTTELLSQMSAIKPSVK